MRVGDRSSKWSLTRTKHLVQLRGLKRRRALASSTCSRVGALHEEPLICWFNGYIRRTAQHNLQHLIRNALYRAWRNKSLCSKPGKSKD